MMQALEKGCLGEHSEERGRKLNSQREAIQPAADLCNCPGVVLIQHKIGPHGPRALHEEPDCGIFCQRFYGRQVQQIRQRQRSKRHLALPAHLQRFPAGCQNLQVWTRLQQCGEFRCSTDDMFEIVEEQE